MPLTLAENVNPVALEMFSRGWTLDRIAHRVTGMPYDPTTRALVLMRAIGTTDLGNDIVSGFAAVAYKSADVGLEVWRKILRLIPAKNFRPQAIPHLTVSDLKKMPEHAPWPTGALARGVLESLPLESHGLRLLFTREAIINDEVEQAAYAFDDLGAGAAKAVAAQVAATLEDTSTLGDGRAYFTVADGNLLSGAPLSQTGLELAVTALWQQPTPAGSIAANALRFLVVPPALQIEAQRLVREVWGDGRDVEVVVIPHLTSDTTWYALSHVGALSLLTLGPRVMTVERAPTPVEQDGLSMSVRAVFRVVRTSRIGLVKSTA
ncbi:MAG: hypothetical protein K2Y51_14240 [Gammaproteobacteria bacterium]|nr:hypothetical protein [Gammaproteobacteria bacterium]